MHGRETDQGVYVRRRWERAREDGTLHNTSVLSVDSAAVCVYVRFTVCKRAVVGSPGYIDLYHAEAKRVPRFDMGKRIVQNLQRRRISLSDIDPYYTIEQNASADAETLCIHASPSISQFPILSLSSLLRILLPLPLDTRQR